MACISSATASELRGVVFSRIRSTQFSGKGGCSDVLIQQLKLRHNHKAEQDFSSIWRKDARDGVRTDKKNKQVNNLQHTKRKNKEGRKDKTVATLRLKWGWEKLGPERTKILGTTQPLRKGYGRFPWRSSA